VFFNVITLTGLLFAAFVAFIAVMRARRRGVRRADRAPARSAFVAAELHAMLASGQITNEEFERLNDVMHKGKVESAPLNGRRGFDVLPPQAPPGSE
jgi:uncharacterized membrane protein